MLPVLPRSSHPASSVVPQNFPNHNTIQLNFPVVSAHPYVKQPNECRQDVNSGNSAAMPLRTSSKLVVIQRHENANFDVRTVMRMSDTLLLVDGFLHIGRSSASHTWMSTSSRSRLTICIRFSVIAGGICRDSTRVLDVGSLNLWGVLDLVW